jgi:hypothetical protein
LTFVTKPIFARLQSPSQVSKRHCAHEIERHVTVFGLLRRRGFLQQDLFDESAFTFCVRGSRGRASGSHNRRDSQQAVLRSRFKSAEFAARIRLLGAFRQGAAVDSVVRRQIIHFPQAPRSVTIPPKRLAIPRRGPTHRSEAQGRERGEGQPGWLGPSLARTARAGRDRLSLACWRLLIVLIRGSGARSF